jgi:hypothetical protein
MMETDAVNAIDGVVRDLEGWAGRFIAAARTGDPIRIEEAVAGLVDWLGHDLVDAFLAMDVATWETLSGLAEELFQSFRAAQAGAGGSPGGRWPGLPAAEGAMEAILERARGVRRSRERP